MFGSTVDRGACPALADREERGGIFAGISDGPFPPKMCMPRNFWRPALRSSKAIAMSVSLGNPFELCALKGVVLPYPENPAYSRIGARWAVGRTARLPLDVYSSNAMGSVLCSVASSSGVRLRPRGSRLRPRARSPCRRPMRAFDIRPVRRHPMLCAQPRGL